MKRKSLISVLAAAVLLTACSASPKMNVEDWVVETSSENTAVTPDGDGLDIVNSDGVSMWYKEKLTGNYEVSYRALVVNEGGPYDRLSDLNTFWGAKDNTWPEDFFKRSEWRGGIFRRYNSLDLFYVGFGGNNNGTTRFRKYHSEFFGQADSKVKPLISEYDQLPDLLVQGQWNEVKIIVKDNRTSYHVDGRELFSAEITPGECDGYFGLRYWKNHVKVRDFKVVRK